MYSGNLCRCTGYRPILDSFRAFCQGCSCKNIEETNKETKVRLKYLLITNCGCEMLVFNCVLVDI